MYKGLDALKDEDSILAMVVPSGFLNSSTTSFAENPDRVLGQAKKRINKYGREEQYVGLYPDQTRKDVLDSIKVSDLRIEQSSNLSKEDYAVKAVIGIDNQGHRYYDQSLSGIEKGLFLATLTRLTNPMPHKEKALSERSLLQKNSDQLHKPDEIQNETLLTSENLSMFYGKRLIDICQCPQAQFLDEKF